MKGNDKVLHRPASRFVTNSGMEPIVLAELGRLMRGSAVVLVSDPEIGRVPECAAPLICSPISDIIAQPEVGCGRRIAESVCESMEGIDDVLVSAFAEQKLLDHL